MSVILWGRNIDNALVGAIQAAAGAAALASAYAFEHLGGLRPCELCIYQRWPWWVALASGLTALLLRARPAVAGAVVALASLSILVGAGLAGFHVGVEQHWWEGLISCGAGDSTAMTVEALRRQIETASVVRCDESTWSIFGVSMAGYNFIISSLLGAGSLYVFWRSREA